MRYLMFLLFVSFSSVADRLNNDLCEHVGDLAKAIMEKRQDGVPASNLKSIAIENNERMISENIISSAYKVKVYSSKTMRALVINSFAEKYRLGCVAITSKNIKAKS